MKNLQSQLEALLFVAAKPLQLKEMAQLTGEKPDTVAKALDALSDACREGSRGVQLVKQGTTYQMVSSPDSAALIKEFVKDETMGELSKPSLETLTIIAYRQPITKLDLDRIRGVNCALILRNLLLHGLIEATLDKKLNETYYSVTLDFIRFLGISDTSELPDFGRLSQHESLDRMLEDSAEKAS